MVRSFICTAYVLMVAWTTAFGQSSGCSYSISGRVVADGNRENICFAEVFVKGTGIAVVADAEGFFTIPGLCAGTYTVACHHIGYEMQEYTLELQADQHRDFYLVSIYSDLHEAEIVGHKDAELNIQSETAIKDEALDRSKGVTLGETLKKVTGVTTLSSGNSISKPVIHGMHSKRLLILNNGIRQEGQQWGSEHGPEIDPFVAGKITVIKGASGVRYGPDAIAGVILVDPAPLITRPGLRGEAYLSGQSNGFSGAASLMLEGSFAKTAPLTLRVQATLRKSGDIRTPRYYMINTGMEEFNVSSGIGYHKERFGVEVYYSMFNTRLGIFAASHIGNLTDLENAMASDTPLQQRDFSYEIGKPSQRIVHHLAKAKAYFRTGGSGKLEITAAFQDNLRSEYDLHASYNDSVAALNKPALQFDLQSVTADVAWNHTIGKRLSGVVGISGLYQTNRWAGTFFIPNFRNVNTGAFVVERLRLGNVELEAGVRVDYNYLQAFLYEGDELLRPDYHFANVAGNAGMLFHFHKNMHFRINYGSSWRPPHVSELFSKGLHHGSAAIENGNTALRPERAHNLNATFTYSSRRLRAEATAYYYYISDFIYLQPVQPPTLTIRGAFPTFEYRQANVDFKGFDLDVELDLTSRLMLQSKTMMLWVWNYDAGDWLINMPANRYENSLTYTFKDWKHAKGFYLAVNTLYVDKQWNAPEGDYLPPPPGYFLLGAEAGCSFFFGKQQVDLSLTVTNLLNERYRDYQDRFRYFSDQMGRNFLLRIKVPFEILKHK